MAWRQKPDADLETYRQLLDRPTEFKDGFSLTTVAGIFFCGLIMMPGAIYLGLMTGAGLGTASAWVTVILFMEMARRALQPLSRQNLVILLHAAHVMMVGNMLFPGGPLAQLVYRAYLVGSEAARDAGMHGAFPTWFAPPPDSPAITERNFLHPDWIAPMAIMLFLLVIGLIKRYTLGYFFFRLTSDVEKLPFPLAPIQAQGAMALAEAEATGATSPPGPPTTAAPGAPVPRGQRWRIFSLGAYLGLAFGFFQVGIPALTGLFLSKPFYLLPQPFWDTTTLTEKLLPATPTGVAIDLGIVFLGFVLPFWAVVGTFAAIVMTAVLNPVLHATGILHTWQPGMNTVNTTFSNNFDFWMSFQIGIGFGIAVVSVTALLRDLRRKRRERQAADPANRTDLWTPPVAGRGDYPIWIALALYVVAAAAMVALCWWLLPHSTSLLLFLIFFAFFYSPFISYVSARLLGLAGQTVDIPFVKETAFLASGVKGIEVWLAPVPVENFGYQAQSYRVNELTGVSFWSLLKTDLVALPVLFSLSLMFWGFIWHANPVPSEMFPAAQINWELAAKNQVLLFSSTFVAPGEDPAQKRFEDSELAKALHPSFIGAGFLTMLVLYLGLTWVGAPVLLVYGLVRGFGNFPHVLLLEIVGALLGRYYFQRRYGQVDFLRLAPVLLAGYFTGVGLIGMSTIALRLIQSAVSATPF